MPEQKANWLFISWVRAHGRSLGIAQTVGADNFFVYPDSSSLVVRYLRSAVATWQILSVRRPKVVFVMSPPSFAAFVVLAHARLKGGTRVMIDLHTGAVVDRKWQWSLRWLRMIMGSSDGYLVTSHELAGAAGVLDRNVFVLHDVIETDDGDVERRGETVRSEMTAIVPLSYSPDEPIDEILGAAKMTPGVVWRLTGSPPPSVVALAPPNVVFTGFLDSDAYRRTFDGAGVVVALTTRPLTMQRAGYEAISRGKALVTSRSPVMERYFGLASGYTQCTAAKIAATTIEVLDGVVGYEQRMVARRNLRLSEQSRCVDQVTEFCNGSADQQQNVYLDVADQYAVSSLRDEALAVLRDVLGGASEVALLDLPTHMNVGDSLIWEGELEFLQSLGVTVRYSSDIARFSAELLNELVPDGPILLHGGGNFGDTWPEYQDFRLAIVRKFPSRRIIQLPQSVYFSDAKSAEGTFEVLKAHQNYTLLVRDEPSIQRSNKLLPGVDVRLCPDMAFGWDASKYQLAISRRGGEAPIVVVARADRERSVESLAASVRSVAGPAEVVDFDWGLVGSALRKRYIFRLPGRFVRMSDRLRRSTLFYRFVMCPAYSGIRKQNVAAGVEIVGSARLLVTDRLHAHIMASMLGVENIALDNHYGKVSAVFAASSGRLSKGSFAADVVHVGNMMSDRRPVAAGEGG